LKYETLKIGEVFINPYSILSRKAKEKGYADQSVMHFSMPH